MFRDIFVWFRFIVQGNSKKILFLMFEIIIYLVIKQHLLNLAANVEFIKLSISQEKLSAFPGL